MPDFSEQFAAAQSNVISWHGASIYGLFEFPQLPCQLTLEFRSWRGLPVQGLALRARNASLHVSGREAADVVLWTDTAPKRVEIRVRGKGRKPPSLRLWNVWRGGLGVTQAWLGNSALKIVGDPDEGAFDLLCSDGDGPPDFDDLVVGVTWS